MSNDIDFVPQGNPALASCAIELLREVLPEVVASMEGADHYGPGLIQFSLNNLHTKEKTVEHVDDLMVCD